MGHTDSLHIVDIAIIIISFIVSLAVGLKFAHRQKTTSNYFIAGGKLPSWAIGISILATLISSITFLAYPGEGYSSNWLLLVQGLMVPIVLLVIVGFIVPLFRQVIKLSAYEYFERRFGVFARIYSSLSFLLTHFSKMGSVFFLLALALSKMTGVDTVMFIWIVGIVVIFITLIGGMEAIVWLDVIQGFLLIIGGIVSLIIILFTAEGGPSAVWSVAIENGRIGFGPFDWDFVNLTFVVMSLNGIFYAIQKYGTDQTIVQRYLTAKSDKDAIKATLLGVLMSVPVWAMFMFIGTALFSYYKISGDQAVTGMNPDAVFPYFIMTKLPVGVVGLVLSGLIAAAISTLNADLNCLSAICVEDYYLRFRPNSSEKRKMLMSKLFVILAGLGTIAIALFYVRAGSEGVLGTIFALYAIFSGGIAGMFLLGIFSRRANKKGLYFGIGASVLFTAYALLTSTPVFWGGQERLLLNLGNLNFTHHEYMIGVYSHLLLFGVGYVASLFFKNENDITSLTYYGYLELKKGKN
ncbi:MAG: sodium:solute symporter [Prolixibacteraceae bacterium]|nr:sodium:solute symporter [Prolixibacteraceae bacterium]